MMLCFSSIDALSLGDQFHFIFVQPKESGITSGNFTHHNSQTFALKRSNRGMDPGFSGGDPNPTGGCQPMFWPNFTQNCMTMKKIESKGAAFKILLCRSATAITISFCLYSFTLLSQSIDLWLGFIAHISMKWVYFRFFCFALLVPLISRCQSIYVRFTAHFYRKWGVFILLAPYFW